ncbi:RNA-directed DNA polymerase, eukaryota [Tanacetum coccineum]
MGFDDWQQVSRRSYKKSSKEDDVARISTSIYVTNFPISSTAKDLFHYCKQYGHVVDSFIPAKKSKDGKRFGFVKFINVFDVDRLVGNLCTVWIGSHRLHANVARFSRPVAKDSKNNGPTAEKVKLPFAVSKAQSMDSVKTSKHKQSNGFSCSFANVVNGVTGPQLSSSPAIVLDDSCITCRDYSKHVMGKVKDVNSIPNLSTLLYDEGFVNVHLKYLGGLWVLLELDKEETKANLVAHTGINSWFHVLQDVKPDFVSDERIVWIDIEGVPINAWTRETFTRIGRKWGELLNIEDSNASSYGRKRLFTWIPVFLDVKELTGSSNTDSVQDQDSIHKEPVVNDEEEGEFNTSDIEGVAETIFEDMTSPPIFVNEVSGKQVSEDPFGLNELLSKKKDKADLRNPSPSLKYPPGYTPPGREMDKDNEPADGDANFHTVNGTSPKVVDSVLHSPIEQQGEFPCGSTGHNGSPIGGSVLGVLEEVIRVGQAMGYSMDGCERDIEAIIRRQGDDMGFK